MSDAQSRVEEIEEELEEAERKNRQHVSELSAVKLELATSETKGDKHRLRVGELERQITDLQASLDRWAIVITGLLSIAIDSSRASWAMIYLFLYYHTFLNSMGPITTR